MNHLFSIALSLLIFLSDHSAGFCGNPGCFVGGIIVVDVDYSLRQSGFCIFYYFFNRQRFVIAGNQDRDLV